MGDGQEERWWPREDADNGTGNALWAVASSRRRTPLESGSAALLEVGGRKNFGENFFVLIKRKIRHSLLATLATVFAAWRTSATSARRSAATIASRRRSARARTRATSTAWRSSAPATRRNPAAGTRRKSRAASAALLLLTPATGPLHLAGTNAELLHAAPVVLGPARVDPLLLVIAPPPPRARRTRPPPRRRPPPRVAALVSASPPSPP